MKSYKHPTESIFILGLTMLLGSQADASIAPVEEGVNAAATLPDVSTTAADLVSPQISSQPEISRAEATLTFSAQFTPLPRSERPQLQVASPVPDVSLYPKRTTAKGAAGSERISQQRIVNQENTQASDPESGNPETGAPGVTDPELGIIRVRDAVEDPELGVLRTREQASIPPLPAAASPPIAFLTGRLGLVSSGNIFLSADPQIGAVGDQVIRPGITLGLYPALSEQTFLIATADVNIQRYLSTSVANYDELRFRLGVRQGLTPRSYAQFSLSHQELFRSGFKDRFFSNNSVELLLSRRDPLTTDLAFSSYYQAQMSFSNPQTFDRLVQLAGAYLSYQITPQLQAGLNYQITLADYTSFERFDTYQQLFGQLIYQLSANIRVNLFGGISFGRSSTPSVRFDDTVVGISIEGTWPLF